MKKAILLLSVISGFNASAQWKLSGNLGTDANKDFIGTLDKESLVVRVDNRERMRFNRFGRFTFHGLNTAGQVTGKNLFLGGGADNPGTSVNNTVLGLGALTLLTVSGDGNTAVGNNVMAAMTSGGANTGLGQNALLLAADGTGNTAVGTSAMEGSGIHYNNTAVGYGAMSRPNAVAGDYVTNNIAVGGSALPNLANGSYNVGVGNTALKRLESGENNVALGGDAGYNLEKGSFNIFIGSQTTATETAIDNQLNIGNWIIGNNGTIGIGQFTHPLPADGIAPDGEKYLLFVKEGIRTEKLKVDVAADNGWADYVFKKDYQLLPLKEVESFIQQNGHLPEVPSTAEAIKNGVELKAMNILLLKKIEELTLYSIEQQKRIEALENQRK